MKEKLQIFIGTFSTNLFSLKFDPETLEIEDLHAIHDPGGRSAFLALDEAEKYLYCANEWMDGEGGIAAFRLVEGADPIFLNYIPTNTQGPAHISTMKAYGQEYVLGSGYFESDVIVCPIAEDGSLLPMSDYFKLAPAARAHSIRQIPGTNFVVVPDTMNGQIYTFEMMPGGKLEQRFVFESPTLQNPRHMAFTKDAKTLLVLTEAVSTFEAFDINRETGELTRIYSCSNLPEDFKEESASSAIHRSPDGRFVYLSNRGHNSIVVFRLDGEKIEKVGYVTEGIDWPREFLITPDGEYMFVGNQEKDTFSIYRLNHETGMPEYTGKTIPLPVEGPGPAAFISIPKTLDY